jgi:hypothetical protein
VGLVFDVAMFVHLTAESRAALIRRNGIRRLRRAFGDCPRGVFAVPVVRNFSMSHQWLRELKRFNAGSIVGVYFRIPDDESVCVGHYHQNHRMMTAAETVAEFDTSNDPQGWEVVIPRRIDANEIHRIRTLPQIVGWRYYPKAKGNKPCPCKFCTRGDYGAQKMRERTNYKE